MNDLLKPRYIVIADYPGNEYDINFVITLDDKDEYGNARCVINDTYWDEVDFGNYPAIFRPLFWWEHREEKEMPEYVKSPYWVAKVKLWLTPDNSFFIDEEFNESSGTHGYIPATETEYHQYINKKQ